MTRFSKCVKAVSKRPGVTSPRGLCAAIGRKKYGAKKFAAMAKKEKHKNPGRKRKNPESSAVQAYVLTHGKQPGVTTEVSTPIKYHSVLAGMGKLEKITFAGGPVKALSFGKGTDLAMNEKRTQLFIVGGDQSVNLRDFGISPVHEKEILGEVRSVVYFTEKLHLTKKTGGKGPYEHTFGRPRPTLVYDVRNKLLTFAGGGYTIPAEGIDG